MVDYVALWGGAGAPWSGPERGRTRRSSSSTHLQVPQEPAFQALSACAPHPPSDHQDPRWNTTERACRSGISARPRLPFVHHLYIFRDVKVSNQIETCAERRVDEAKVALAASLVDVEEATALAQMFRLLGDPTRVRILFALLEAGELCVCDIAAVVETTETKVSQAMSLLRTAGVVRNRRDGRNIFYRLDDAHVRMVLDISREHLAHHPGTEG